jgi:hypothetical protein
MIDLLPPTSSLSLLPFQSAIRIPKSAINSLVPKPILIPAIRALPGNGIAGHAP